VIEKCGAPTAVPLSIRDYIRLAGLEPELLGIVGEESRQKGLDKFRSRQIDQIIQSTRAAKAKRGWFRFGWCLTAMSWVLLRKSVIVSAHAHLCYWEDRVMSALPSPLTIAEFERLYGSEPGWEYWFGKAIRKPVPTWFHAVLQGILTELLYRGGYLSGSEVDLRARPDWRPRPDVAGALKLEGPHPSKLDVAIEILSDDQENYIRSKCLHYAEVGIPRIFAVDPGKRTIQIWNDATQSLDPVEDLHLANGATILGHTIWREFDKRIGEHS
jgi:Uma2 family endonuclease